MIDVDMIVLTMVMVVMAMITAMWWIMIEALRIARLQMMLMTNTKPVVIVDDENENVMVTENVPSLKITLK